MKPSGTSITTKLTMRAAIALVVASAGANWCLATPAADISSAGPLTHIWLGNDLSCQVQHIADAPDYEFYGPDIFPADAGTFIAMDGVLYAPDFANHDYSSAESFIGPYTPFTPVSQTPVTGSGTATDPFKVITVADVAATGLVIQQTDSYVVGEDHYHTDIVMTNNGTGTASGVLYRAGDTFLGGSDSGYGFTEVFSGGRNAVGCSVNANNSPPDKIEEWIPSIGGNNYLQDRFDMVWGAIGSKAPFPDTCQCTTLLDNGAGISWNFSIPPGGSLTYSQVTGVSPQGLEGLVTSKTADSSTSPAGTQNGYTITIQNPNANAVTVNSITDTLPAGFVYVPGSTTGATTNDPAIVAQMLTWSGSFSVPASGSISLHFTVIVAVTPGDYFNEAGGSADGGYNVIGTGSTAQIMVTAAPTPTPTATATPESTATPTATATATATATSTPTPPGQVSKITPTGTTCTQFANGTAQTLSGLNYSVKNGAINQVNPGVFFYWVRVTVPAGNNSFALTQTITTGNFDRFFPVASGSNVFDSNCNSLHPTITQNPTTGTVTVQWNAPTAGTYFISIKYSASSLAGIPAPGPGTTVHYDLMTTGVPGSTSGLDLLPK